jgi:phosphoribosylanthranilate isomerase
MKIGLCTLVGADDLVSPDDLLKLSLTYSFVEWGIAYDPARFGKPRYPNPQWIASFQKVSVPLHKALHLSGTGLADFAAGASDALELINDFDRIQLNFGSEEERTEQNVALLIKQMSLFPHKQFIIGLSSKSEKLLSHFAGAKIAILFDSSGGKGKRPSSWPSPLPEYDCGYAGGINPLNITDILKSLQKIVPPKHKIWIDMESGLRTSDDKFNLNKSEEILQVVSPWTV